MESSREKIIVYVAGVTHNNRQKILKKLYVKYSLGKKLCVELKHDVGNYYDPNAIKILVNKKDIGFIPMKISEMIHNCIKKGLVKKVRLYDIHITGNVYGASIIICL